jgi:glycosyltransferase involved in cell wall biosynthesis
MISRLDSPKRIDMLVRAMKYVRSDVRLLIAGTGPQADELHRLAEGDERIRFLGFVNDEDAERYYADSLVIPYFPYDEDYGLITIEAMMHRKPVITTFDAGGPTEFVVDGETGFVTMFEEKAIAEKIDYFAEHPEKAREMGENAYNRVKNITWENTVMALLQGCDAKTVIEKKTEEDANRKKIVLTSTFSIYPPQGGGQARTYDLYKNVAEAYDVQIVSFGAVNEQASEQKIAGHMIETKIPKTEKHQREESEIEKKVGIPITDIAMFRLAGLTPEYGRKLKAAIETSDIVVCSHPYLYPEVKKYLGDKPFIYEAQDVEYEIKKGMLPKNDTSEKMLKQIYEVEKECCEKSQFILTCSEEDKIKLHELYGVPLDKILPVANGVDCKNTRYTNVQARLRNKERMGLSNEKMALFMGSWHGPNLESCEEIIRMAPQCPDVKFLLMGSQCGYFKGRQLPENIGMLGVVDEETKNRVFATVDFALNPMLSGSGTNLKMFDYMAAGLPVITTRFGTRGIEEKEHFTIAEVDEMPEAVRQFSLKDHAKTVEDARKYMENTFDWKVIAEAYIKRISSIL